MQRPIHLSFRRALARSIPLLAGIAVSLWAAGQCYQDLTWLSGLCFYCPSSVLASGLAALSLLQRKRIRAAICYALLAVPPLLCVLLVENHWIRPSTDDQSDTTTNLRVLHWNIARTVMGWEAQKQLIHSHDPGLIVLSETSADVLDSDFPGFQVLRVRDMLVASSGRMHVSGSLVPGGALDAVLVTCELPGRALRLIVADMTSNLNVHRDLYLQPFLQVIREQQPDLIVGDFNAPRLSRAFRNLPEGWRHAYDAAGAGWSSTWPVPVPVLAIDQCICGPRLTPVRYELRSTLLSDHRIQILDCRR